jgi:dTDP-4-dehydrorhamnose reductase
VTRVLVTGAGGQLGRELAAGAPWPDGWSVVGLDRAGLDVEDAAAVDARLDALRPALVVNAAAWTAVDKAESEPARAFAANATAVGHLARACAARGVGLVSLSTDYVFDGSKDGAWTEDDPVAPLGVYGASKRAGEEAILAAGGAHWVVRTSWVVGVHGANFVKTIDRAARERERLRVVADQRGCPTPARDLAAALATAAPGMLAGAVPSGVYHLAGAPVTTWHALAAFVVERQARHTGRRPPVDAITTADWPTPARRPANSALDCAKWERATGQRRPDWEAGVAAIVDELHGGAA